MNQSHSGHLASFEEDLGLEMLTYLFRFSFFIHTSVCLTDVLLSMDTGSTLYWELSFALLSGTITLFLPRSNRDSQQRMLQALVVLILLRWTHSWMGSETDIIYASTLSGLLYLPPVIAAGVMSGLPLSRWIGMTLYMGIVMIIGSQQPELIDTPFSDWRAGPALISSFALLCIYLRRWSRYHQRFLESTLREKILFEAAQTDMLTGLLNRRAGHQRLDFALNTSDCVSLLLLDIDRFKRINDTHGHQMGDQVLSAFSDITKKSLRKSDIIIRWGGEEFIVVLINVSQSVAVTIGEKLRANIEQQSAQRLIPITVSIGLTQSTPDDDIETLIRRADKALYQAKNTGRNKLVVYRESAREQAV